MSQKPSLAVAWSEASPELLRVTRRWAHIAGVLITALVLEIIAGFGLHSVALVVSGIVLLVLVGAAYWRWASELNARARWEYQQRADDAEAGQTMDRAVPAAPRNAKFMIIWCCGNVAAAIGVASGAPGWVFVINLPLLVLATRERTATRSGP
ncbi:MAG: hypothetical protein QOE17_245 [Gaiellales bacterium]|nr:hypothetical protein [Gaiellales bacterium]